jgi:GTPase Era involved in 16S rRNA processing
VTRDAGADASGDNSTGSGCTSADAGWPDRHLAALKRARKRIVVLGEFNSGKTALVNAIVGAEVLKPSFVTHTAHPTVVRFAAKSSLWAESRQGKRVPLPWGATPEDAAPDGVRRVHVGVPLSRLAGMTVIDTPGFGLADGNGPEAAQDMCRRADTVIWCTPAMQAWKASEEQVWLALPERVRRRGVLAVTFADEIASPSDTERLMARLQREAGPYFRSVVTASACTLLLAQ